jgi:hypothetical protein
MGKILTILFVFVIICYMARIPPEQAATMAGNAIVGAFDFLGGLVRGASDSGNAVG